MTNLAGSRSEPPFDDGLVDELLNLEEGRSFETKRVGGEKLTRALETIVAFANTDGGWLVLGLEDADKAKGRDRVYGIQENPAAIDELRRLVSDRITPCLSPERFIEIGCTLRDGGRGSIVIVQVAKSAAVHSIVADGTWRRLGRGNRELVAAEITSLAFERGTVSAESRLADVPFDLVETEWWRFYAMRRKLTRPIAEALRHLGLAKEDAGGKLMPTWAAVLLFAEEPSGLLRTKASVRILQYKGEQVLHDASPNLLKPPVSFSGSLAAQSREPFEYLLRELTTGVQMGPAGLKMVQRYPARVIQEAITNAVIHRDYSVAADVQVRVFPDRIEVESPGALPGNVTARNIQHIGSVTRNPLIVSSLREFPDPPNLDAGEGVRMMFQTMNAAGLYPPVYLTRATTGRNHVLVVLLNESRPSTWDQVCQYLDKHGVISNADVRRIMQTQDVLTASKALRDWVNRGLLVVANPESAKQHRKYRRPEEEAVKGLFSERLGKDRPANP